MNSKARLILTAAVCLAAGTAAWAQQPGMPGPGPAPAEGQVTGEYEATGYVPKCFEDLISRGVALSKTIFDNNSISQNQA